VALLVQILLKLMLAGITLAFRVPVTAAADSPVKLVPTPVNDAATICPVVEMLMPAGNDTDVGTTRFEIVALLDHTLLWVIVGTVPGNTLALKVPVTAVADSPVRADPTPENDSPVTVPVVEMFPRESMICLVEPNVPTDTLDATSGPVTVMLLLILMLLILFEPLPIKMFCPAVGAKNKISFDAAPGKTCPLELHTLMWRLLIYI